MLFKLIRKNRVINPKTNPVEYLNIFEGACIVLKYNPQDKR